MNTKHLYKTICLVLVTSFLLGLGACAPAQTTQQVQTPDIAPTTEPGLLGNLGDKELKVALILPGVHTDFGWNYVAFEALSNLKSTLPNNISRIDYTELVDPGAAEKVIRDYIAAGYNLIFVHGYQYKEGVDRVIAEKPANVYIVITEGTEADLVEGYVSYISPEGQEASYILGTMAAGISKSGKVGVISGMESVDVLRDLGGFKAGVEAYDNGAQKVTMTVVGNWDDPAAGKKAAEAMMSAGVDVIYCMGDGTSIGVIQAVTEARTAGKSVYYIGYPSDQHAAFSDTVLTSIVYNFNDSFLQQAKDALQGNFGKQGYSISLDKGISIAPFYQFEDDVSASIKTKMQEVKDAILSGSISVPK